MAKKGKDNSNKKDSSDKAGNKILTILIALMIVIIWLAVFGMLIKLDVGGFGSGVLRPILKDVPVVNQVLPSVSDTQMAQENNYQYTSMAEAIAKINELEAKIAELDKTKTDSSTTISDLQAEVARLKVFEDNQKAFEARVAEFDKNVVYAAAAPSIEEYKKYYEAINPTNAAAIYQQVVTQLQYSDAIKAKADIYKNMDPAAAAQILQTMTADIESVAKILLSMKSKESAAILANMDNVVAAKITKKMLDMDAANMAIISN